MDAGAYGLTVIVAGVVAALRGSDATRPGAPGRARRRSFTCPSTSRRPSATAPTSRSPAPASTGPSFVTPLEGIGDSVLVVGDESTLRVHVHTDEPEAAVAIFGGAARCRAWTWPTCTSRWPTAAPASEATSRASRAHACGVVAVASGPGIRRLYEELGALVVDGGPTMNPSTYELLAGIHSAHAAPR